MPALRPRKLQVDSPAGEACSAAASGRRGGGGGAEVVGDGWGCSSSCSSSSSSEGGGDIGAGEALHRPLWTFSSSGWLFVYHFGVIKCLKDLDLHRDVFAIGSSGGSCAGAFLHMDHNIDDVVEHILGCAEEARSSVGGLFRLKKYVQGAMRRFITPDLPSKLQGNYEISVTQLPWMRNRRVTSWSSVEEVEASVLASSCAVPLAGMPVRVPGLGYCIDGMFSDFQLVKALVLGNSYFAYHDDASVTICPFYSSRAHIKPSEYVPLWWAFLPPPPSELWRVYELGQRDAKDWVIRNHGKTDLTVTPIPPLAHGEHATDWDALLHDHDWENVGEEISAIAAAAATSFWGMCSHLLASVGWTLVYWELFIQTVLSALAALLAPLLPKSLKAGGSTSQAWRRCLDYSLHVVSPKMILKTVPAVGGWIRMRMDTVDKIFQKSFVFRLLWYLKGHA